VKNDPIRHPESDKKIRLRLAVLLGIRLHPKTSDSLRLRFRHRNPGCQPKKIRNPKLNKQQNISQSVAILSWSVNFQKNCRSIQSWSVLIPVG